MIVWLWDAGTARGVTDNDLRAREAAEAFIGAGGTAVVEMAALRDSPRTLNPGYTRLGCGWTARGRADGRVRWQALGRPG